MKTKFASQLKINKRGMNSSKISGHDKTGTEPQNVLTAFHSLGNKLVDCHLQYNLKIGNLVSVIEKMLAQQKSQEELQSRYVQLHCEYSKKIDNLVSVVKKMEEQLMTQQKCQEELQSRNIHLHVEYTQKIDNLV